MRTGTILSPYETARIRHLLADTDISMTLIAERMDRPKTTIVHFNEREHIREYSGHRTEWTTAAGRMDTRVSRRYY